MCHLSLGMINTKLIRLNPEDLFLDYSNEDSKRKFFKLEQ